ncbi:MAG TPA: hypothetical protein VGL23_02105, partial [Chloroflexota bacterium]
MWLFLIPIALAAVGLMLVVGTAMAIFAVAHAMPWLLILAGVWLVVAAGQGRGRWRTAPAGHRSAPSWSPHPAPAARPHPAPPRPGAPA